LLSVDDPEPLSWLGVPLKSERGIIGVLVVQSYSGKTCYTETDLDLLHYVSVQVATAIEHKTMLTRLEYMAQYDQLTGLPNRELFIDRLHVALAQARRDQKLLALLFIDLDKFKSVNDTLGHAVGDLLLKRVAERLNQCVRAADTVARLGGDEFVVLIDGIRSEDNAFLCAEKIHKVFVEPFEIEQQHIEISPSIGVAVYPTHGEDEDQLLKYADMAMYDAKKLGGKVTPSNNDAGDMD
jgi:diguanylate cyclase (GGDEF)-like protein